MHNTTIEVNFPTHWTPARRIEIEQRIHAACQPPITQEEVVTRVSSILQEYGEIDVSMSVEQAHQNPKE